MTTGPDLAQRRAKAALDAVKKYRDAPAEDVKTKQKRAYAGYVKSLPAAIVMNGLGQALATELAAAGKDSNKGQGGLSPDAHGQIYLHLQDWLCGKDPEAVFPDIFTDDNRPLTHLLSRLYGARQPDYLRAQAEALLYLGWLKKFAVALLANDEAGDEQ